MPDPIQSPTPPPPPIALAFRVTLYFAPHRIGTDPRESLALEIAEALNGALDYLIAQPCDVEFLPPDTGIQDG